MAAASAKLIDGNAISATIRAELKEQIATLKEKTGKAPKLVVVLVGERKDSQTYVRMKTKACEEVGITSVQHTFPADVTEATLLDLIDNLNADKEVNGILVQLPLPGHINSDNIVARLHPSKDVDGLTAINLGRLLQLGIDAPMIPCTPLGCIELLDRSGVKLEGTHAVVVGRSQLVGKPVAQLLLSRNATVTQCHSKTPNLPAMIGQADVVVAAMGKADFIKGSWLKPGAVVIDVGINAVDDATKKAGYRLVGDVDFQSALPVASAITPVPGGVGPMTVAMLLRNTVRSFQRSHEH